MSSTSLRSTRVTTRGPRRSSTRRASLGRPSTNRTSMRETGTTPIRSSTRPLRIVMRSTSPRRTRARRPLFSRHLIKLLRTGKLTSKQRKMRAPTGGSCSPSPSWLQRVRSSSSRSRSARPGTRSSPGSTTAARFRLTPTAVRSGPVSGSPWAPRSPGSPEAAPLVG